MCMLTGLQDAILNFHFFISTQKSDTYKQLVIHDSSDYDYYAYLLYLSNIQSIVIRPHIISIRSYKIIVQKYIMRTVRE